MASRRITTLALALLTGACADAEVDITLTPNRYLILPFATAEVSGSTLTLTATNLWPLAAGRRYLCWLKSSQGGSTRLAGEIKGGRLVVTEAGLGSKLSDHDRMSCTVESDATPSRPSSLEALHGEPGGVLLFGTDSLLDDLKNAAAECHIDGFRAEYAYRSLPRLPEGFRYGIYLKGSFPDPNAGTGNVGHAHQHLTSGGGTATGTAGLTRLGWLEVPVEGEGVYWEPGGQNLTGHRAALLSIEAVHGDGQPTLFALAGPEGAAPSSSSNTGSAPTPQQVGSFSVTLEVSPQDIHVGDLVTLTFRVSEDGAPVSGLTPAATYQDPSGATGNISLAPGSEPGSHVGARAFFSVGLYRIQLKFTQAGQDIAASFDINVVQH